MASLVGWHEVGGYFTRTSGHYLVTPKLWIADVESYECATDLVTELTKLRPVNDQEWERHRVANPRYGMVRCDGFSRGAVASALAAIEQLWSNEPMDWADLVRPILPRVNRFLGVWRAITDVPENSAIEAAAEAVVDGHANKPNGETVEASEPPADLQNASDDESRDDRLSNLNPANRKAYYSYHVAEIKLGGRLEDRDAYEWLTENGIPDDVGDIGELADYDLPAFDTWSRQLRFARKALGEQKYSRRAHRATGRSIARLDEI
jgi:hypothetical protein